VINFKVDATMTIAVGNGSLSMNLTSVEISNMKHKNSTIGGMRDSVIKDVFDMMIGFIVPMAKSVMLPELPYIELNNSVSRVKPGYLELFTDIDVNKVLVEKILHP